MEKAMTHNAQRGHAIQEHQLEKQWYSVTLYIDTKFETQDAK